MFEKEENGRTNRKLTRLRPEGFAAASRRVGLRFFIKAVLARHSLGPQLTFTLAGINLMKLTKKQVAKLKNYREFRDKQLTLLVLLNRSRVLFFLAAIMIFVGVLFSVTGSPNFGWFLVGFNVGGIFCVLLSADDSVRNWPFHKELMRWSRVEELIKENKINNG